MNRTRPKQIVIRVSEEELMQIKEKVAQSGKNQQEYIIEALTQPTITNTDGIKELIPELKRIGNNLNQIAHALNGKGYYNDSAQKTPAGRKNVRGMNAPITNNATIIPTGVSSGIVGFSWPDVLQNAVIRCIALLFQEKHFR